MKEEELLQIIEQAPKEGVTKLNLSGKELTLLPSEIGQLTKLTQLSLTNNRLSALHAACTSLS
jgi:Leucine-rich repeat (LRR) protein